MRRNRSRAALCVLLLICTATLTRADEKQTLNPVDQRSPGIDFVLEDAEGNSHRLSDYRGKVVALNFWATWCPPCLREMPSMQRLKNQVDDSDFVILAVNVGEDEETVFRFIFAFDDPIDFPLLLDQEGKVTEQWPVVGLPTSFILDKQGRIVLRAVGGRLWDAPEFASAIAQLVEEK